MTFVHQADDFGRLIDIVAEHTGVPAALVEKDYWVTHCLWALHETRLDVWFKGGTSLSKGFGLIQRFSEDLDLLIEAGDVTTLPSVTRWKSEGTKAIASRRLFFDALVKVIQIPNVTLSLDKTRQDDRARSADYLGHYPSALKDQLPPEISPFVRLEVGRARVVPCETRRLTSFVHDHLETTGQLDSYTDNRPAAVRCLHPMVTLLEKLDALDRRQARGDLADTFVRHYEDAASIIRKADTLPPLDPPLDELIEEMVTGKDIRKRPSSASDSLQLRDTDRKAEVEDAHHRLAPLYWGDRIDLDDACETIRKWIDGLAR